MRDPDVWTKTPKEKKALKSLRKLYKKKMYFHIAPPKHIPVYGTLIVQLKKNNKFPNTTYSMKCWQHEIGGILEYYGTVAKYSYNGKTYKPEERPFWY